MAGHSKWANTKYRKATQDAKRGKMFTKIIRELVTATRLDGGNFTTNPRLRAAIDKALSNNMTRDTLNRAILRGLGNGENENKTGTFIYEGYGPGGTAIIVKCLSNNRNRIVAQVRHAFSKFGGNLSVDGSVSYLFIKKGVLTFNKDNAALIMNKALKIGAEKVFVHDGKIDVYTALEKMDMIQNQLISIGFKLNYKKISMIASFKKDLNEANLNKLLLLVRMLKSYEDVQEVFHNGKIPDKIKDQSELFLVS